MGVSGEMSGNGGARLKVDFNPEDAECTEVGDRELRGTCDDRRER